MRDWLPSSYIEACGNHDVPAVPLIKFARCYRSLCDDTEISRCVACGKFACDRHGRVVEGEFKCAACAGAA